MDPNWFDNAGEQCNLSIMRNLDLFAVRGVFSNGDNTYSCLPCHQRCLVSNKVPNHIARKKHCSKVEYLYLNCDRIPNYFICKLCTDYVTADWKAFIIHFDENAHFDELRNGQTRDSNSIGSKISYVTLVTNQIIEYLPGTFFCCRCKQFIFGWNFVLEHTQSKQHNKLQSHEKPNDVNYKEGECRKLAVHCMFSTSFRTFSCYLCNCCTSAGKCCFDHIAASRHIRNMTKPKNTSRESAPQKVKMNKKSQNTTETSNDLSNSWETDNSSEHLETDKGELQSSDSYDDNSSLSSKSCSSKLIEVPKNLIPLISEHCLQRLEKELFCTFCKAHLHSPQSIVDHINSRRHIAKLKNSVALNEYRAKILNEGQSSATTSETSTAASSSPVNVLNKKASSRTKCSNNQSSSKTIAANLHDELPQPKVKKIPCSNNQSSSKTIAANLHDELPQPKVKKIPQDLVLLIEKHSLVDLEDEIYCPACKRYYKHATSVVSHTNSTGHARKLRLFRKKSASKNVKIETSSQVDRPKTPVNKTELNSTQNISESVTLASLENFLRKLKISKQNGLKKSRKREPLTSKSGKQNVPLRNGRSFDPEYLKVDMQHIYEINSEKLRLMELSCQLCFPKSSHASYCLVCETVESDKLQHFYEHICSTAHMAYLAELEQNDKHFIKCPNQFSDLRLAKEYMQQTPNEDIQCHACDVCMKNDDIVILEHVNGDLHKICKQVWNTKMEKKFQYILVQNRCTWYNIYKYWCQVCYIEFNTECHFAEHLDSKGHKNELKTWKNKPIYDSCVSCARVFLGSNEVFAEHCEQPMHRYLVRHGDFQSSKLSEQAITLLLNAEAEVENLIELANQVFTVEKGKADLLIECLEYSVSPQFPNAKAYPFGSRVSGLGFPDSDIDVFLDCGTYDGKQNTDDYERDILLLVEQCLISNEHSWDIEETLRNSRTPIIKLRHRDSELSCDISFKNGLGVENTNLLKCFIDKYPLCRKLMLFIKKWLSSCNLSGSQYITNYAMCWWIIFYLQSKKILPSIASMIAKGDESKIIAGWETGVSTTFDIGGEDYSFLDLLYGFFIFYINFDYHYSVACPLVGNTVQKEDFTDLDRLPKEMAPYVKNITTKAVNGPVELFRIDSEMCIQDPYDLSYNLTKAVKKSTLNRFKQLCEKSAKILNDLKKH